MATTRPGWRSAAYAAVLAVGAACLLTVAAMVPIWWLVDALSGGSGIGYAGAAVFLGFPASVALYLLGGALVVRVVAARRRVDLSIGRSVATLAVAGVVGFSVAVALTDLTVDSDVVAALGWFVGTIAASVPLVRWLGKTAPVSVEPRLTIGLPE